MRIGLISDKKTGDIDKLIEAFRAKKFLAEYIDVGNLGIYIEKNAPKIFYGKRMFKEFDSIFLSLPLEFTLFAEPFIAELVGEGIYCQFKPNSYYVLSNKPYLYSNLTSKGIRTPNTDILADKETVDYSMKEFSYPVIVKTFTGLKKTNSVLAESERSLKSFTKSISSDVDAITIQDYLEGDVDQSLVIGENVFTVKRKWVEQELSHSKKPLSTKLSDSDMETAIRAAKVCGMDIGVVKMINGLVTGVRNNVDFKSFGDALSKNMYEKVAEHYLERLA